LALDNYTDLQEAIADYLDDDLTDQIKDFIRLAEARHRREIRIREMVKREAITVNARYIDFPTGFLEARNLRIITNPMRVLSEVSVHEMNLRRRDETGLPSFVTFHEQIEFDVVPDSAYNGEIIFYKAVDRLSDSNTTNDILDIAPDAYLYGALLASAPFLLNDERVQLWGTLYAQARDSLNATAKASRRTGPLVSRVTGATP
ncbi:MAG TPA: hypothetical protein VIG24_06825, partial [Acidimicrobiia bacterium]